MSGRQLAHLPARRTAAADHRGGAEGDRRAEPGEEAGFPRQLTVLLHQVEATLHEVRGGHVGRIAVGLWGAVVVAIAAGTAERDLLPAPAAGPGEIADS